jgi:hypothetical protein
MEGVYWPEGGVPRRGSPRRTSPCGISRVGECPGSAFGRCHAQMGLTLDARVAHGKGEPPLGVRPGL